MVYLQRANDLVRNKIHPTSIISGYRVGLRLWFSYVVSDLQCVHNLCYCWQLAMREACKYIDEKLVTKVSSAVMFYVSASDLLSDWLYSMWGNVNLCGEFLYIFSCKHNCVSSLYWPSLPLLLIASVALYRSKSLGEFHWLTVLKPACPPNWYLVTATSLPTWYAFSSRSFSNTWNGMLFS